ncbi:MAG: HNH endonuclease, partial [Gemmatimonadetes bacterium]|nr:HNH endonuclease [Gemmatimonadota bacterium]
MERLGDEIAELAAHLHAGTWRLLVGLREFDEREGWSGGFISCAHWLSWRTGIAPGAAREKVRVARALAHLPRIGESMRRGVLSYAKVRALSRVATPANEAELLDLALHATAAQVEKLVRAWRRVNRLEERREDQRRYAARRLTLWIDADGSYVIRGRLDPETGALLERALEAGAVPPAAAGASNPAHAEDEATYAQRRVDALRRVAELALDHPARRTDRGSRFQVVVHVDSESLENPAAEEEAQCVLGDGVRVSAETSRRLACDCTRVVMVHDAAGNVLNVGRRTRTVPAPIRRALEHRDRGRCRFPGCTNRICDAHHLKHWAEGGETRLANLVLLCTRHHTMVHEGRFRALADDSGGVRFLRPDGCPIPTVPGTPELSGGGVESLVRANVATGITIDAWTAAPDWHGERLDAGFAVLTLRRP